MELCDFNHDEIVHSGVDCPLCMEKEERKDEDDEFFEDMKVLKATLKTLEDQHANCLKHS